LVFNDVMVITVFFPHCQGKKILLVDGIIITSDYARGISYLKGFHMSDFHMSEVSHQDFGNL